MAASSFSELRDIEACGNFVAELLAVCEIAVGVEPQVVRLLDVRGGKQRVGDGFIHAHSGSQRAAADIRDAAEHKETLHGAVFAVIAEQQGEEDINDQNGIARV